MKHKTGARRTGRRGLLLLLGLVLTGCGTQTPSSIPPNIVLITLESIRTDHVGCYSGLRPTSPTLDALAAEGMVYEDAHSVTSWTLPAHASIFTGLYPTAHQAIEPLSTLGDSYTTLAEILTETGYQCAGVASGPYLLTRHNLNQGFELYDDSPAEQTHQTAHGDVTNPEMEAALNRFFDGERDPDRPFFLFAYFWDPHYDYIPPAPYDAMFVDEACEPLDLTGYESRNAVHPGISEGQLRYVRSQYDGEIRWTDDHLERLFRRIRDEGLWDDTVIIVTADHGEEFFDHGSKGHKNNLYVESLRVPLVIKYAAGGPRGRDARPVSLVDLFPTVLELAGAPVPDLHQGRSVLGAADPDRPVFYELLSLWFAGNQVARREEWLGIRQGDHKLITVPQEQRLELYDVRSDPAETANLATVEKQRTQELLLRILQWRNAMRAIASSFRGGEDAELSEEDLERMRSLGYLR